MLVACKIEKDMKKRRRIEEDLANRKITEQKETCWDYIGDKLKWFSYLMISEDERQARTRRRTFDSTDQQNESRQNPFTVIELPEISNGDGADSSTAGFFGRPPSAPVKVAGLNPMLKGTLKTNLTVQSM